MYVPVSTLPSPSPVPSYPQMNDTPNDPSTNQNIRKTLTLLSDPNVQNNDPSNLNLPTRHVEKVKRRNRYKWSWNQNTAYRIGRMGENEFKGLSPQGWRLKVMLHYIRYDIHQENTNVEHYKISKSGRYVLELLY